MDNSHRLQKIYPCGPRPFLRLVDFASVLRFTSLAKPLSNSQRIFHFVCKWDTGSLEYGTINELSLLLHRCILGTDKYRRNKY